MDLTQRLWEGHGFCRAESGVNRVPAPMRRNYRVALPAAHGVYLWLPCYTTLPSGECGVWLAHPLEIHCHVGTDVSRKAQGV